MKAFLGIILFCSMALASEAQRDCSTVDYKKQLLTSNPAQQAAFDLVEQQIATYNRKHPLTSNNQYARDTTPNEVIFIPVVIHVLYQSNLENISLAQIQSQIDVLNKDFNNLNDNKVTRPLVFNNVAGDAKIKFCLAQVDPFGRRTTGIVRKQTSVGYFNADDAMKSSLSGGDDTWNSKKYLNIWVCKLGVRSLGYSTPPGSAADKDGVVISYDVFGTVNTRAPFNKGRTATHEIGHWLGLKHIWGDELCGNDDVDDTPTQKSYNYGCPTFPSLSTCSPDANGDMFMNFMDFSDDGCMSMFTNGQKRRMRALFAEGGVRNSFLTAFQCDSTLAQAGPLPVDTVHVIPVVPPVTVKVYPNPVSGAVVIECSNASQLNNKLLRVYSAVGVNVLTITLTTEKTTINLSKLTPGMYIVRVGDGSDQRGLKIVKL